MNKLFLLTLMTSGFLFASDTKDEKVNQEERQKNSEALLKAISSRKFNEKNTQKIDEILKTKNFDIEAKDDSGRTPLMAAVVSFIDDPDLIEKLINAGADVNALGKDKLTPIMYAVMTPGVGNVSAVKLLIKHGANLKAKSELGGGYDLMNLLAANRINIFPHVYNKLEEILKNWTKIYEEYDQEKDEFMKEKQKSIKEKVSDYLVPDLANIVSEYHEVTFEDFIKDKYPEKLKELEATAS